MALGKEMLRQSLKYPSFPTPDFPNQILDSTDRKVVRPLSNLAKSKQKCFTILKLQSYSIFSSQKLLDCLFSDIEIFVNQLQRAIEAFNNLKKRRTIRENGSGGENNRWR